MTRTRSLAVLMMAVALPTLGERHVNAASGADSGDCTAAAAPCRTITYAMARAAAAAPGEVVSVAPGTYNAALGEAFPIVLAPGVQLRASGTAAQTVIDGDNQRPLLRHTASDETTLVEGFTLRRGFATPANDLNPPTSVGGAALRIEAGKVTIRRNAFLDNVAHGGMLGSASFFVGGSAAYGGAIHAGGTGALIESNVFSGNLARGGNGMPGLGTGVMGGPARPGEGGAIYVASTAVMANNTFHANEARGGSGTSGGRGPPGYGGSASGGAVRFAAGLLVNNIFSANRATIGDGSPGGGAQARFGAVDLRGTGASAFNLYFGNSAAGSDSDASFTGVEGRFADPRFVAPPLDLQLQDTSPALGAGTAASAAARDFAGAVRPRIPSIGAHESTAGIAPTVIDFGAQSMGTASAPRGVSVRVSPASLRGVSLSGTAFTQANDCSAGAAIAAGSCLVTVAFAPPAVRGPLNEATPASATLVVSLEGGSSLSVALQGTVERSLVRHYYTSILRRTADEAGRAFWAAEAARVQSLGASVNEAWFAMAGSFFESAEYRGLQRNDTGFVTDLYKTFFGRAPDDAGLSFWTGQLSSGFPREAVLTSFMFSAEFRAFTGAIFAGSAVRPEKDLVMDFYRGLLGRLPEDAGFISWTGEVHVAVCRNAASVRALADSLSASFLNSAEYAGRGRSDAQYVADLYNAFLRRGGDFDGVRHWIGRLAADVSREELRRAFVQSPEFTQRVEAIVAHGC